ncbi:MAG TPA: hypothetical protein DCW90_18665 [Lachnospiraceae bacterium]|nr:hypothetical protein [Lachnospiraceae bacterium]
MNSFLLDKKGDLKKVNGDFQFISGKDEVVQQIKQILKTNKGEWFRNEDYGISYENLQQRHINEDLVKDVVRDGISQCSEDITIESIEIGYKKEYRLLYVEFKAYFSDGERYDNTIELDL